MSDILFEITEENLNTGLLDIPIGYCVTSLVDDKKRLYYVGHPIQDISNWSVEKVIYLLFYKQEGSQKEVLDFASVLRSRAFLDNDTISLIKNLPSYANPMDLLSIALQLLAINTKNYKSDFKEDSLNIISKMGVLIASVINHHNDNIGVVAHNDSLDFIDNFLNALRIQIPNPSLLKKSLSLIFKLHLDYGGKCLPSFVAKVVSSSISNFYRSIASSLHAFAGFNYSNKIQSSLLFVKGINRKTIEKTLDDFFSQNKIIPGFNLEVEDSRATILYGFAREHLFENEIIKKALILRDIAEKKGFFADIDAISGAILSASGFDHPNYFLPIFSWARSIGIVIQLLYERSEACNGNGLPMFKPKYIYKSV